ncbi:MAG: autotransporter outer membrane beta-barrel domain-containing protein [Bacteroidales bacterium]|nr:autotransporter outer membrane beta-barrel domain-containing protein [Bacteroidales bacterium]
MKTEDFDDAIRKKLEGPDQKYTEQDIDKVVHHIRKNHLWSRGGISGPSMIITIAAAAALGILLWYTVRNSGDSLAEKKQIPVPEMQTVSPVIQKDSSSVDLPGDITPEPPTKKPVLHSLKRITDIQKDTTTVGKNSPQIPSGIVSVNLPVSDISDKNIKTVIPAEPAIFPDTMNVVSDTFRVIPPSELPGQWIDLIAVPVKDSIDQESVEKTEEKTLPAKPANIVPEAEQPNKTADSLVREPNGKSQTGKPKEKKGTFFSVSGVGAGAGFEYTGNSYGLGLKGNVSLENRLGLSIGLKYADLKTEHFDTRDDFDRHDHHRKNHHFEEHLNGHDHATGIDIQSNLIQLPVALSYTFRLPRNFGLGLSVGTDLDLLLNQRLEFDHGADSLGPPRREDFRAKGDAVLFNNLVFSIGLEKQWKGMVFQVQPFVRPRVKELFYKSGGPEYGLGFSVMYKFGR